MSRIKRVALIIETSREYGRGLLRGISRFNREHEPWSVYFQPRGTDDPAPSWLTDWKGDGILARIETERMAEVILQTGAPTVDLRFLVPDLPLPSVGVDVETLASLAMEHFLNRGFERFAFCGTPPGESVWMDLRGKYLHDMALAQGLECEVYDHGSSRRSKVSWEQDQRRLIRWLRGLRKPIAVMACNDLRGLRVLDACRRAGIGVPEEVCVLGVDNDEFLCAFFNATAQQH